MLKNTKSEFEKSTKRSSIVLKEFTTKGEKLADRLEQTLDQVNDDENSSPFAHIESESRSSEETDD
jgi:hypothetical protein